MKKLPSLSDRLNKNKVDFEVRHEVFNTETNETLFLTLNEMSILTNKPISILRQLVHPDGKKKTENSITTNLVVKTSPITRNVIKNNNNILINDIVLQIKEVINSEQLNIPFSHSNADMIINLLKQLPQYISAMDNYLDYNTYKVVTEYKTHRNYLILYLDDKLMVKMDISKLNSLRGFYLVKMKLN